MAKNVEMKAVGKPLLVFKGLPFWEQMRTTYWNIIPQGCDKYFIENVETERYLFQDGEKIKCKRGDEGGWKASSGYEAPSVLGADANYYNRAYWKLLKQ